MNIIRQLAVFFGLSIASYGLVTASPLSVKNTVTLEPSSVLAAQEFVDANPLLEITRCSNLPSDDTSTEELKYESGGAAYYCLQNKFFKLVYQAGDESVYTSTFNEHHKALIVASGNCGGQPCNFQVYVDNLNLFFGTYTPSYPDDALKYDSNGNTIQAWRLKLIEASDSFATYAYGDVEKDANIDGDVVISIYENNLHQWMSPSQKEKLLREQATKNECLDCNKIESRLRLEELFQQIYSNDFDYSF